jgi:hypothetical protein
MKGWMWQQRSWSGSSLGGVILGVTLVQRASAVSTDELRVFDPGVNFVKAQRLEFFCIAACLFAAAHRAYPFAFPNGFYIV